MDKMNKHATALVDLIAAIRNIESARHLTPNGLVDDHCYNALGQLCTALKMSVIDLQGEIEEFCKQHKNRHH